MPDAIDDIRKAGVGPVDMQQSVIGPGMGVFTRYAKVLESDDSPMSVKMALSLINRVWEEIENELDANFDPETQVALAWFASYGYETKKSGELATLANAKNIPDRVLFEALVFKNLHGQTALTPRSELPLDWSPAADRHVTVWRCVQQTARILKAEEGGGEAAARLVAQMGARANDEAILNEARWEIARSVAWGLAEEPPAKGDAKAILDYLQTKASPVYDPFSGGGSIPLEAQRLGLRAYGSDLNPVAVLIGKALVEIPPKFAGRPPVNPKAQTELKRGGEWNGRGARGLAEDVRYYGQWIRDQAERRIGHLYPKVKLPDGSEATVVAWLWARTVRSPDPAARGAMVPLVASFILSTKEGRKAWAEPVIDASAPDGWRFEVKTGVLSKGDEHRLKDGTKGQGRGSDFACVLTGSTIRGSYIKSEGTAGRMHARLMAIVAEGSRNRVYLSPERLHEEAASRAETDPKVTDVRDSVLNQPVPEKLTGGTCYSYGLTTFAKLFSPRQLVALTTFSDLVGEARGRALADARASGLSDDGAPLHSDGSGATAYADAVATYLAFSVTNVADRNATVVGWASNREHARNVFARQAIPMVWDYCESNVLSESSGNYFGGIDKVSKALNQLVAGGLGSVRTQAAQANNFAPEPIIISTDPPYYDNISYADLSDFFYIWLRRTLSKTWPDLFRRLTVQKDEELVATSYRHGGRNEAEAFFMRGMGEALSAMGRATTDQAPLAIYYAFKQSEAAEDGVTSAGWASFLQAVVNAGLAVNGTWPLRTELERRLVGRNRRYRYATLRPCPYSWTSTARTNPRQGSSAGSCCS